MDAKITKTRLSRMLSYDWLKMIGMAAAIIFVWVLVFTMTATRVKPSQQFGVSNYVGNVSLNTEFSYALQKDLSEGVFSHEVLEISTHDLTAGGDQWYQLLQARTTTNELDVMFVSMQGDESSAVTTEKEDGTEEITYKHTYLESFLYGYRYMLHNLSLTDEDGYFKRMEAYLNAYYDGGYESGSINASRIEEDFRARAKATKDKRYKKEAEIQKGVQGEIERVQKYRDALVKFYGYLASGNVTITQTTYVDEGTGVEGDVFQGKGSYSINLCPETASETQRKNLAKLVGYRTTYLDEDGKEQNTVSAVNMNICLFDSNGKEEAYRYEGLIYVSNLLDSLLTE